MKYLEIIKARIKIKSPRMLIIKRLGLTDGPIFNSDPKQIGKERPRENSKEKNKRSRHGEGVHMAISSADLAANIHPLGVNADGLVIPVSIK